MGHKHESVTYFRRDGLALDLFRCTALEATLSMNACAGQHLKSQQPRNQYQVNHLTACRSCPIGAAHAGIKVVHYNPLFGSQVCPRCGFGTTRMIHGRICVNCYNRQREIILGRNAKGIRPKARLHPVELHYHVDGRPARFRTAHSVGTSEAVAHVMRMTKGRIEFQWSAPRGTLKQGRLL